MRLIDADALKEDLELSKYIIPNELNRLLNSEINRCIEAIDNAPTIDDLSEYSDKLWQKAYERGKAERLQVIRKDLESWLYEIAMNNFGNELERSCIEIISRLDGFERYVKEKEVEND